MILELGVGKGSLLKSAIIRWKSARFFTTDIDSEVINQIALPRVKNFNINCLHVNLADKIDLKIGSFDIAFCNPPYKKINNSKSIKTLLKAANLHETSKLKKISSDIVFLAHNLIFLKNGGELGIILPDSLISCQEFSPLRYDLLENHKIINIIQLPDKVFKNTEARTHILLIEKCGIQAQYLEINKSNQQGILTKPLKIKVKDAFNRMDYDYHSWAQKTCMHHTSYTLNDIGANIQRGSFTANNLKKSGVKYFHTDSFQSKKIKINAKNHRLIKGIYAKKGDLLIARVGNRCIGKVAKVNTGRILITDCILKISLPYKYRNKVIKSMLSKIGQDWFRANAHGVCARVISVKDLLNYRI